MVLWDSRTIHCGRNASMDRANSDRKRLVAYVCMLPHSAIGSKLRSEKEREWTRRTTLAERARMMMDKETTNHWPNERCRATGKSRSRNNGTILPVQDPTALTDIGRRLSGMDV